MKTYVYRIICKLMFVGEFLTAQKCKQQEIPSTDEQVSGLATQ